MSFLTEEKPKMQPIPPVWAQMLGVDNYELQIAPHPLTICMRRI